MYTDPAGHVKGFVTSWSPFMKNFYSDCNSRKMGHYSSLKGKVFSTVSSSFSSESYKYEIGQLGQDNNGNWYDINWPIENSMLIERSSEINHIGSYIHIN